MASGVREAFANYSQLYGTRRLRVEVQADGHAVEHWRVLQAHGQPPPAVPNRVWVGNISYLPRQGSGWLYLAFWLDYCSRKVVGYDVRETMPEDLVSEALRRALTVRRPPAGLIGHSNQGNQYRATRFQELLARTMPSKA